MDKEDFADAQENLEYLKGELHKLILSIEDFGLSLAKAHYENLSKISAYKDEIKSSIETINYVLNISKDNPDYRIHNDLFRIKMKKEYYDLKHRFDNITTGLLDHDDPELKSTLEKFRAFVTDLEDEL